MVGSGGVPPGICNNQRDARHVLMVDRESNDERKKKGFVESSHCFCD